MLFEVETVADIIAEPTESFTVSLSAPTGAILGDATVATVSISDRKFSFVQNKGA